MVSIKIDNKEYDLDTLSDAQTPNAHPATGHWACKLVDIVAALCLFIRWVKSVPANKT